MSQDNKEKARGADPKLIVAVQMLSIGIILLVLGLVTFFLSSVAKMEPFIRLTFLISMGGIIAVGLAFGVGGGILYRRAKKT
jgi:nitrate reductase gamma subunit